MFCLVGGCGCDFWGGYMSVLQVRLGSVANQGGLQRLGKRLGPV